MKPVKPRIHWATNFAAPYRRPVWADLSVDHDLQIHLIDTAGSPDGRVRGHDWFDHSASTYGICEGHGRTISIAGQRLIMAGRRSLNQSKSSDVLVLGGWEHPAYWQLLARAKRSGVRAVGFYESTQHDHRYPAGPINAARGFFFRQLDSIVVPGIAAAEAVQRLGVPFDRIHQGFNAVDVQRFREARMKESSRPTSGTGLKYLYVGQLIERKNVSGLLRAFAQVRGRADTLTIVGSGVSDDLLRRESRELRIADHVTFTGDRDYEAIPSLMVAHHCLVLPSHSEVWGLVVNEALAAGLHCVVSRRAGIAPDIMNMPGVFIADPTVESLVDQMSLARDGWTGPVSEPPILGHTPHELADTFRAAMASGVATR